MFWRNFLLLYRRSVSLVVVYMTQHPQQTSITGGKVTIVDVVRMGVLGLFIHQCILWLDPAEREELKG
jgi:hypothetical protein